MTTTTITNDQYQRDQTWLKSLPPLEEINAGLADLQAAIDAARVEYARLSQIIDADPGYAAAKRFPAPERFIETEEANGAWDKLRELLEIPGYHGVTYNAVDFVRRRPNGSKQKYPVRQWRELGKRLRKWVEQ